MGVSAEEGGVDPARLIHNLIGDGADPVAIEVLATDPWRARMQVADTFRSGRVFLAGDAAHQNPPWGGHGFNTGIGDAANIGWKLSAVLNGWGSETLLDSYEIERRPVARETIAVATRNMSILGPQLADPRLMGSDAEFSCAQPVVAAATQRGKSAEFHSLDLVLGTSYADSPIVIADDDTATDFDVAPPEPGVYVPSAAAGNRLPHKWFSGHHSLFDSLGSDYSLVGELNLAPARQLLEAAASLRIPLAPVQLDCQLAKDLFAAPLVLVRPDQHVAWRGSRVPDPEALMRTVSGRV